MRFDPRPLTASRLVEPALTDQRHPTTRQEWKTEHGYREHRLRDTDRHLWRLPGPDAGAFSQIDGVASAALDLKTKRTTIVFNPARIDPRELTAVLTDAGYPPEDEQSLPGDASTHTRENGQ